MVNVFIVVHDDNSNPNTFVARDASEAYRMFHIWRERHAPIAAHKAVQIMQLSEHDLDVQPQLKEAASSGHIGVAWWLGHREGWLITAPDADAAGRIAPPFTAINCYVFHETKDFGTIQVFAETHERAVATLHLHSLDQCGWDAKYDQFSEISPWLLMGEKIGLREDMFDGLTGVGMECEDGSWHIFPADYEPPLTKRNPKKRVTHGGGATAPPIQMNFSCPVRLLPANVTIYGAIRSLQPIAIDPAAAMP